MARTYKIRYGVIPARSLSPFLAMTKNQCYEGYLTREIGHPLSRQGAYKEFYQEFRREIKEDGVRNPVLAFANKEGTYVYYGGTRTWLCQEMDLKLPVIIADLDDVWPDLLELHTEEDILEHCPDTPKSLVIKDDWLYFTFEPHPFDPIAMKNQGKDWAVEKRKLWNGPTPMPPGLGVFSVGGATTKANAKGN